jgi:signal transduction histidine kinase
MAVVPAFGLLLYSAAKHRELTAGQVKQNALVAARVIASEQDRVLENAHEFLVTLSRVPQIQATDKAACRRILSGLLEPRYADLVVADRAGNPLCTALPAANALATSHGIHHTRSVDTYDFSVGAFRYHPGGAKILLDVAYPVMDQPGVVRAVVSAALDMSWINHASVDSQLSPGSTFTMIDAKGVVLLRYPEGKDWIGKSIFPEISNQGFDSRGNEKTIEASGPDGIHRLFALSRLKNPIGGQAAYAAVDLPTSLAFAETKQILIQNLITLGILSAIILATAWFGSDVFVLRRIQDIIAATKQMAAGNLRARTTLSYDNSELGGMARAFDHLADALEKREREAVRSADQIHQQRQRQDALYALNRGITSTLDVTNVLSILLDHISALFPAYAVSVNWINTQTKAIEPIAFRGPTDSTLSHADLTSAQTLPLEVLRHQTAVAISDARADPRAADQEILTRQGWISYLGLPLTVKNETLGVLSFYGNEPREFSSDEINFLTALVNEAATAIHNSQLFEQTRRQAIELEKSNKIKDEFLGVMSHELRTPLNIIMNYSEALRMGTFGEIGPDQARGTEKIRVQASHLLSLINGILEITKIESGMVSVEAHPVDLKDLMAELRSDYVLPLENDVALVWDHFDDLPIIVSDRIKLKQILTNLINNAIKFTDQGSITISGELSTSGQSVKIHVADTGLGIPREMLPFVFDKFRQIDSATTRNHSGAGLGLYIVKNFTTLLGGTVEVQSHPGKGSVFTVRLPIQPGEKTELMDARLKSSEAYTL